MMSAAIYVVVLLVCAVLASAHPTVIGVGAGRTGTDSLKEALIELGFGPTYHMKEVLFEEEGISTAGHIDKWTALAKGEQVDIKPMMEPWGSAVDWPASAYPEELFAAYPDAKYVLTTRPADKWIKSCKKTVCFFQDPGNWALWILKKLPFAPFSRIKAQGFMTSAMFKYKFAPDSGIETGWDFCTKTETSMAAFETFNQRVISLIPKEQLLVFEVGKHKYADLAKFLGVPTPDHPFPHANSSNAFSNMVRGICFLAAMVILVPTLLVLFILRKLYGASSTSSSKTKDF